MIIYRVECLNEDGNIEINGHFLNKDDAERHKEMEDNLSTNKKYGIRQHIIEILVE